VIEAGKDSDIIELFPKGKFGFRISDKKHSDEATQCGGTSIRWHAIRWCRETPRSCSPKIGRQRCSVFIFCRGFHWSTSWTGIKLWFASCSWGSPSSSHGDIRILGNSEVDEAVNIKIGLRAKAEDSSCRAFAKIARWAVRLIDLLGLDDCQAFMWAFGGQRIYLVSW